MAFARWLVVVPFVPFAMACSSNAAPPPAGLTDTGAFVPDTARPETAIDTGADDVSVTEAAVEASTDAPSAETAPVDAALPASCFDCVGTACGFLKHCGDDSACNARVACWKDCEEKPSAKACRDACKESTPSVVADMLEACMNSKCATQCG